MSDEISQGLSGTDSDNTPVGESSDTSQQFGEYPELGNDSNEESQSGTTEGNESKQGNGHPAWQPYLEEIPEPFRQQVTPAFEKWDKDAQEKIRAVQSKYAPYEPFIERDPQELQAAIQISELLRTNPKALYDNLAQRFGFNANSDQGQSNDEDSEFDPFAETEGKNGDSIENDPRFKQLSQELEQLKQFQQQQIEQQQAAQAEAEANQQVQESFGQIEAQIKRPLNEVEKAEILKRTVLIGDSTGNYDVLEGYKDFAKFANSIRNQPRANDTAPAVLSGNGGLPVKSQDMSLDQKFNSWADQIAAMNK